MSVATANSPLAVQAEHRLAEAVWFGSEHMPAVTFDRVLHDRVVDLLADRHLG